MDKCCYSQAPANAKVSSRWFTLTANGKQGADVAVGQKVEFSPAIEVLPGAGSVVAAEWDFEGAGDYPLSEKLEGSKLSRRVTLKTT